MSSLQSGKSGCDRLSLIALTREQQLRFCFPFSPPPSLLPSNPPSILLIHRHSDCVFISIMADIPPLYLSPHLTCLFFATAQFFCCFVLFLFSFGRPASALPAAGDETKSCCSHCRQTSTHHHHTPMTYHLFLLSCSLPYMHLFLCFSSLLSKLSTGYFVPLKSLLKHLLQ